VELTKKPEKLFWASLLFYLLLYVIDASDTGLIRQLEVTDEVLRNQRECSVAHPSVSASNKPKVNNQPYSINITFVLHTHRALAFK
jgi:50S ribosomal subunit-associated GTPase HflX